MAPRRKTASRPKIGSPAFISDLPDLFADDFFKPDKTQRMRRLAKSFYSCGYVHGVQMFHVRRGIELRSKCYCSQKKHEKPHVIHFIITDQKIEEPTCTCKAGISGNCTHTLAVVFALVDWHDRGLVHIPDPVSSTSRPQQWSRPRGPKIHPAAAADMVFANPNKWKRKRRPPIAYFEDTRSPQCCAPDIEAVADLGLPISYLCQGPHYEVSTCLGPAAGGSGIACHAELINQHGSARLEEKSAAALSTCDRNFPKATTLDTADLNPSTWTGLEINMTDAMQLEENTRNQTTSSLWWETRAKRITSSKFGSIMLRKSEVNATFIKNVMTSNAFSCPATRYGIATEKTAKNVFARQHPGAHFHDTGVMVNPAFPFLASSPDGIVCVDGQTSIVEVKCPYKGKDGSLTDAKRQLTNFCLEKIEDKWHLKRNHAYWWQIQGQLLVSGAMRCLFIVYCKDELHYEYIDFEPDTCTDMLQKLYNFFRDHVRNASA